jgi:hypothetical protein
VRHVEEKAAQLLSQSNALRQEEIIEVILLSADIVGGPLPRQHKVNS